MNTNYAVSLDHIVLLHTAKSPFMCSDLSRSALLSHTKNIAAYEPVT